jgi:hypothetical protein
MTRRMRGGWRVVLVSLFWSAAPACHGRDISLGTARGSAGDLSRCGGSACEAVPEFRGELDESHAMPCSMRDEGRLVSVWRRAFRDHEGVAIAPEGCTEIEGCEVRDGSILLATTSDGTLWLAAIVGAGSQGFSPYGSDAGIWMARHAPDGTLLGAQTVEVDLVEKGDLLEYSIALAAAGSEVLLGVAKRRALAGATDLEARSWVQRFDASGEAVGAPLELEGDYPGSDGALTLAAAEDGGGFALVHGTRMARFEAGQRRWVQALRDFPNAIAADSELGFTMLAEFYESTYHAELAHYDARGQPSWMRTTQRAMQSPVLAFDAHGDLIRAGILVGDDSRPPGDEEQEQILHKLSKDGATQWLIALRPLMREGRNSYGYFGDSSVIRGEDGHVWVNGPSYDYFPSDPLEAETALPEYGLLLYEVALDASYCRAYELPDVSNGPRLVTGPEGELYYVGDGTFGRLRRP